MTAPTPDQAAANAFVTGCVKRGLSATQACVPPEGQLATVRGLWADVAQAAIATSVLDAVKAQPGDTVVVALKGRVTPQQADYIRKAWTAHAPDVKLVLVDDTASVNVQQATP